MKTKYLRKNKRYTLMELNKDINNIDSWKDKICSPSCNHKEPLESRNCSYSPKNPETYFLYQWQSVGDISDELLQDGSQVKYLKATAVCEFSKRKINDTEGNLLSKSKRLNIQRTPVLFVQIKNRIYCIVFTLDEMEIKRIRKLISNSNIAKLDDRFNINSELFSWLFFEERTGAKVNNGITIRAIKGFSGKIQENESKFAGKSIKIPSLIVTKTFLVGDYELTTISLKLDYNGTPTEFYIERSTDELKVMVVRGSGTDFMFTAEDVETNMPIYMFFRLIPTIVFAFKKAEPHYEKYDKKEYLKELGMDVIKIIMEKSNITKEEMLKMLNLK